MNEPLTVALTFKPTRADGLFMLLTTNNSAKAIFAAGLRNGRVLVYNITIFVHLSVNNVVKKWPFNEVV